MGIGLRLTGPSAGTKPAESSESTTRARARSAHEGLSNRTRRCGLTGKFMRIWTFYYLPPKAGFNWRGPARR
jgi:hypothetical protein